MRIRIGNPVEEQDFFPRPDVVGRLVDDLVGRRGSRRLFGLRRIGKTSITIEVERQLRSYPGLTVVRLDVQGLTRFDGFMVDLVKALPERAEFEAGWAKVFSNPRVHALFAGLAQRFAPKTQDQLTGFSNEFRSQEFWAGDFSEQLSMHTPLVLIVDELPFMLRNMVKSGYSAQDVECFMALLRGWRHSHDIRMLFTGSLGFGQLARDNGINLADCIADMVPLTVPPLRRAEAIDFVSKLASGEDMADWTEQHSEAVVEGVAETWPIFLQTALEELKRNGERRIEVIQSGPSMEARRNLDKTFFEQYQSRLGRYGPMLKLARSVLRDLCKQKNGALSLEHIDSLLKPDDDPELRDTIVAALEEDDFIQLDPREQVIRLANGLVETFVLSKSWGR